MTHNPKLFREMSEPFPSMEEAQKAVNAFFEELGDLRKKHKITNVHAIIQASTVTESGDSEADFLVPCHYGDSQKAEMMCAYGYGRASQERQERHGEMLKGSLNAQRNR